MRLFFIFILISFQGWAITMNSIKHGVWNEPSTWSSNTVPIDGDSIYVHHEVLVGGINLTLNFVYLNVTVTGCLCGLTAELIFHNSILINDGHMAFPRCELHDNSIGTSSSTFLLTQYVLATSNSSMTFTNGSLHITPENDLRCDCFDTIRFDSLNKTLDSNAIINFNFRKYFDLKNDTLTICIDDSVQLHYKGSTFEWSDGSNLNYIIPETNDWISILMIQNGDTILDSVYIKQYENFNFIFPNVYTPNDDGLNDEITINKNHIVNLELYNRWGRCIYSYDGAGLKLDGFNINDGVYYYLLHVESKCEIEKIKQKGWLQVLR